MSGFTPPAPFELSDADRYSATWMRLKAHLQTELQALRERNDAPQPEQDTAMLRGQIRSLKRIIALGDDRPIVTGDEDTP